MPAFWTNSFGTNQTYGPLDNWVDLNNVPSSQFQPCALPAQEIDSI